ncbi:MAG: tRNA (N(6)-L-threonylcarbamoyladenosine(37)-C(2))-methylthiotransferase MtaB [Caldisericaceae bacterium]
MKIAIATLGCKTNQYESELIKESFEERRCEFVDYKESADLYIVNSCVVTGKAEAETRKLVSDALRNNPEAKVILTGCFVPLHGDFNKKNVLLYSGERRNIANFFYERINTEPAIDDEKIKEFSEHTRAVVKIEEGCNNFCTYCVVPFTRGYYIRSKGIDRVVEEVSSLVSAGYKEIVLTGTEIGKYGEDKGTNIATLLSNLKKIEGLKRLRISSIHPKHVTDELIGEISYPIVPHLHISLQSGDNEVLKRMNRGYTIEHYLDIVKKLRNVDKNFSISTDLIVGFPGETEDAFLNTMSVVSFVQLSKVHIFRFSRRPFTPAFYMEETVSEQLKKLRSSHLKELANSVQKSYKERFIGKAVEVLVEDTDGGLLSGFTPYYLRVKFNGKSHQREFAQVRIERVDEDFMYGTEVY